MVVLTYLGLRKKEGGRNRKGEENGNYSYVCVPNTALDFTPYLIGESVYIVDTRRIGIRRGGVVVSILVLIVVLVL